MNPASFDNKQIPIGSKRSLTVLTRMVSNWGAKVVSVRRMLWANGLLGFNDLILHIILCLRV